MPDTTWCAGADPFTGGQPFFAYASMAPRAMSFSRRGSRSLLSAALIMRFARSFNDLVVAFIAGVIAAWISD